MDLVPRVALCLFAVASARQLRAVDSEPTREQFLAVQAENEVLREENAALRAGRGGAQGRSGGRALTFGYHATEDWYTMETCMEDFNLMHAPTAAPTAARTTKPTGALGDHSSFTQTRDCAASCRDCDEVDFSPYVQGDVAIPADIFSGRTNCVCVHIDDTWVTGTDGELEQLDYSWFDHLEDDTLQFTPYDDCVNFRGHRREPGFGYGWYQEDYGGGGTQFRLGEGDDVVVGTFPSQLRVYGEDGDDTVTLYGANQAWIYGGNGDDFISAGQDRSTDYWEGSNEIMMKGDDGTDACRASAYQDYDYDIRCICETCDNGQWQEDDYYYIDVPYGNSGDGPYGNT